MPEIDTNIQDTQNRVDAAARHQPHKGNYGVCAPASIAGDQRAMVSRPYATVAHCLKQTATPNLGVAPIFAPLRDNTAATDGSYVVGTAGIGDAGTDCGILDTLTRAETSFFAEGYPFRDYEFVLKGLAIVPEGKPFMAASTTASATSLSIGGTAAGANFRPAIIDRVCSEIADSVVSAFFQSVSIQLGFKSESAKWDLATPMFHPGGLGLVGSSTPTNASPIGGKTLTLPFDVQLPRANHRGVSVAQIIFRQEQSVSVIASGTGGIADLALGYFNANTAPDSLGLIQKFKVVLIGERQCAALMSDELLLARMAQQYGCTVEQARAIRADLQKQP